MMGWKKRWRKEKMCQGWMDKEGIWRRSATVRGIKKNAGNWADRWTGLVELQSEDRVSAWAALLHTDTQTNTHQGALKIIQINVLPAVILFVLEKAAPPPCWPLLGLLRTWQHSNLSTHPCIHKYIKHFILQGSFYKFGHNEESRDRPRLPASAWSICFKLFRGIANNPPGAAVGNKPQFTIYLCFLCLMHIGIKLKNPSCDPNGFYLSYYNLEPTLSHAVCTCGHMWDLWLAVSPQ